MMETKKIIAMDLSTSGHGGGPYTSTSRIMSSNLKDKYDFKVIEYDPSLGRFISVKRIINLTKQIKQINPDIVHFTGLQLSGFHLIIACKLAGVKRTVLTIRGMSGDSVYFNKLKKLVLKYIIEPLTLLLVDRFYCVSNYVNERRIPKLFSYKSLGCIYNYPPLVEKSQSCEEFRASLGFKESDTVVVSVARINKEKGYHILEKVIRSLKGYDKIKFLIVGDGDYLPKMKENLQDMIDSGNVYFPGKVKNVEDYNNASDIFVLPTLHETLSVALLEASLAKLALVASNTGGIPEIVKDGYNGYLVKTGCEESLKAAILNLDDNKTMLVDFGENAYQRVKEKFSEKSISDKIDKVYCDLLRDINE